MNSRTIPAEHLLALLLNLSVIAIAAISLAKLLPQSIRLHAKHDLISQQLQLAQSQVQHLEQTLQRDRSHPHINAKSFANLSKNNNISILWDKNKENK